MADIPIFRRRQFDRIVALLGDERRIVLGRTRGETRALIIEVTEITIEQQEKENGDTSSD